MDDPISGDLNSDGHTVSFNYDAGDHVKNQKRVDDQICIFFYDTLGRMTRREGYADEITKYTYDASGNISSYKFKKSDGTFITYTYAYDALDRQMQMAYAADVYGASRSETYHYDIANHLDQYTNPAGQVKTLTYDKRGRLTNTSWNANGPNITIVYDAASRPASISTSAYTVAGVTLPTTTTAFGYDNANNRIYEDQTVGNITRRVQTDPDADGSRKNLLVKTGSTINFANYFDYTSRNELLNIKDSSQNPFFKYFYDASGNVTQRQNQRLSGDSTMLQDHAMNRPIQCNQNRPGATNFAVSHYDYTKRGNLRDTWRDEEGGKGEYFTYDDLNQLQSGMYSATGVKPGQTASNPAISVDYTLSKRTRSGVTVIDKTVSPQTTTTTNYTSVDLNQYSNITVNGVNRPLSWDNNFNLITYNGWAYSYDAENRLISVSGSGHSATFTYDAVGRCVKRVVDGVTRIYTYDQWTPVAEWDGSGNLIATNVYGLGDDEVLYRSAGSTQLYFKSDPMGNVKFLLDASGNGIEKYSYDAFGQAKITDWNGGARSDSTYGNRFMYSGREFFSGLGLYDMRHRVYDPNMGRFYQTDPIGFGGDPLNLYRFSGNNPLLGGDPMGLFSIGGAFTAVWNTLSSAHNYVFSHLNVGSGEGHSSSNQPGINSDPLGVGVGPTLNEPYSGNYSWSYTATAGTFAGGSNPGLISSDYAGRSSSSTAAALRVFTNVGNENPIVRATLAQMMGSPLAAKTLARAAQQGNVDLVFNTDPTKWGYYNATVFNKDTNRHTIYWDPLAYYKTADGRVLPPVLLLAHEIFHTTQPKTWWFRNRPFLHWWEYSGYPEYDAIVNFEQPVADELGLPKRFSSWKGRFTHTPNR